MKNAIGPELTNKSIAVIYRAGLKRIVGEFEVIRVETIEAPETPEGKEIYSKAFGYPVTLYSEMKGHEPLVEVPCDSLYYNVKITAIRTFKFEHGHKLVPIPSVDLFAFHIVIDRPGFVK